MKLEVKCFVFISLIAALLIPASADSSTRESAEIETYDDVNSQWSSSKIIDFDEYWPGENHWGGAHRVYPVTIDTRQLVEESSIRPDCRDIRVASEGKLVGSRVQEGTCGTNETKIFFGNVKLEDGDLRFNKTDKVESIEIFYGNQEAGLGYYSSSVYNDGIASMLKPESLIGMYYGHHTYSYVSGGPTLQSNDLQAPRQEWYVDFTNDHNNDHPTDRVYIRNRGQTIRINANDNFVLDSGNVPSNVQRGDTIDLKFETDYNGYGNYREQTSWQTAQYGARPSDPDIQPPSYQTSSASGTSSPASISGTISVGIDNSNVNNNRITSCSVTATGQNSGGTYSVPTTITDNGNGQSFGTCTFTVNNNDNPNWRAGEELDFTINVQDNYGNSDTFQARNTNSQDFPNSPPETVQASVDTSAVFSEGVWGGQNGIPLNVQVTDYESSSVNSNLDVEFFGDQGQIGSTRTISNGQGQVSVNWERNNQANMLGFDRGQSYNYNVEAEDLENRRNSDGANLMVMTEASVSNPSPVSGNSGDTLDITVSDNPAVRRDGSISSSDVKFFIKDGPTYQLKGTKSVSGSSGQASLDVSNLNIQNPPATWKFEISDTYSSTDYIRTQYNSNTNPSLPYSFITAQPPKVLPGDPNSYPIGVNGVELDPNLNALVSDPDGNDIRVRFYKGSPGTNKIGETVVSGGSGVASLGSSQHNLGSAPDQTFDWSVEVEDAAFNKVAQSNVFTSTTVGRPQIVLSSHNAGDTGVSLKPKLQAGISQPQDKNLVVKYSLTGGGKDLSHTALLTGSTSSAQTVSHTFSNKLDENTDYTWSVNASFTDESGNTISKQKSVSFTTDVSPSLGSFEPVDDATGQFNPVINVSFNNNGDATTARLYNWENGNLVDSKTGITSGSVSFNTSNYVGFGEAAGETYFWYTQLETEATGAVYDSNVATGDPFKFELPNALSSSVNVIQGQNNLNPGVEYGQTDIKVNVTTGTGAQIDRVRFKINGSEFINKTDVSSGEVLSADITNVTSEDETYTWSATASDQGVQIGGAGDQFTTYVLEAQVKEPNSAVADLDYNLYHANSNASFDFGNGAYDKVLTTSDTTVEMAFKDFGTGSDDCFKATSQNLEGESLEAYPLLGDDGQCAGNQIP